MKNDIWQKLIAGHWRKEDSFNSAETTGYSFGGKKKLEPHSITYIEYVFERLKFEVEKASL